MLGKEGLGLVGLDDSMDAGSTQHFASALHMNIRCYIIHTPSITEQQQHQSSHTSSFLILL